MPKVKRVTGKYTNPDAIDNVINYIFEPKKIPSGIIGAMSADTTDTDLIIHQFYKVQKFHRNCKGKRIIHIIVSFSLDEMDMIPLNAYLEIGYKIIDFFGDEYQSVFALHENKKNLHFHYAINPVNITSGKKYPWQRSSKSLLQHQANLVTNSIIEKYNPNKSIRPATT